MMTGGGDLIGAPRAAPGPRLGEQALGLARLVHPLPSLLDALIVASLALVAGAEPAAAGRAALAMLLLQFSIGAANDLADAPTDRRVARGKPIPAGTVSPGVARVVAVGAAAGGLALAAAGGAGSLAVAIGGLAAGLAYDLRLKQTAWSWLPYAVGIPLLLAFGWTGAGLPLPGFIVGLAPMAALAGAQLAVANALADLERDRASGLTTVATSLGPPAARRMLAVVAAILAGVAWLVLGLVGASTALVAAALAGTLLVGGGVAGSWLESAAARRRGWEMQGVGLGLLAVVLTACVLAPAPA